MSKSSMARYSDKPNSSQTKTDKNSNTENNILSLQESFSKFLNVKGSIDYLTF